MTVSHVNDVVEPQWIIFSASEFSLAQFYAIIGAVLTKKLFALSFVDDEVKKKKRFALWRL